MRPCLQRSLGDPMGDCQPQGTASSPAGALPKADAPSPWGSCFLRTAALCGVSRSVPECLSWIGCHPLSRACLPLSVRQSLCVSSLSLPPCVCVCVRARMSVCLHLLLALFESVSEPEVPSAHPALCPNPPGPTSAVDSSASAPPLRPI